MLPKRRNAQNLTPLYGFGAILGVFFQYERLCFDGGILTVRHSKAAVCRFRVTKTQNRRTHLIMLGLAVLYFFTSHMLIFKCRSFSFPIPAIFRFQMDSTLTNPHAACIESIPSATDDLPAGYHYSASVHIVPCSTDLLPAGYHHSASVHVVPCSIDCLPAGRQEDLNLRPLA